MERQNEFFQIAYAVSLGLQLGFLIAIPIALFLFLGYWLDGVFRTWPLFFIIGIVTGITATGYEVYRSILPLLNPAERHA